jgi:hypothetical protein
LASRKEQKEQARQARLAAEAKATAEAARRRWITRAGLAAGAVAVAVVVVILAVSGGGGSKGLAGSSSAQLKLGSLASLGHLQSPPSPGSIGPEGIPVPNAPQLAGTGSMASGNDVDGVVSCLGQEQTLFHIHAHLTVFVDGAARQIPYGVGITNAQVQNTPQGPFVGNGNCFYFLHTHAADGIIHIESPVQRTYTLGNFFDVWGQPLGPNRVGPAVGTVTALYNGKPYLGNPRDIPLNAHAQIQLDVGRPLVAPESITFAHNL